MIVLLVAVLSVALHVLAGWQWTALAAFAVGVYRPRWAALRGGLGVALGWGAILLWSYVRAAGPTAAMLDVLGGILGNMPGTAIVGLTFALAFVLGALGGWIGALVRILVAEVGARSEPRADAPGL